MVLRKGSLSPGRLQEALPRRPGAIGGGGRGVTRSSGLVKQPINKARPRSCQQLLTCSDDSWEECVCVSEEAGRRHVRHDANKVIKRWEMLSRVIHVCHKEQI